MQGSDGLQDLAREALGFELRPEQVEAAEAAAGGRTVHQAAGLVRRGRRSSSRPLIRLRRDQLESNADVRLPAAAAPRTVCWTPPARSAR